MHEKTSMNMSPMILNSPFAYGVAPRDPRGGTMAGKSDTGSMRFEEFFKEVMGNPHHG
jgi:hypothetical protein